jgi:hypothetical protein
MTRYSVFGVKLNEWVNTWQNRERREQLAAIGVGGMFESIIQVSTDPDAHPRKAQRQRYIGPTMRLLELAGSGEFRAEVA